MTLLHPIQIGGLQDRLNQLEQLVRQQNTKLAQLEAAINRLDNNLPPEQADYREDWYDPDTYPDHID